MQNNLLLELFGALSKRELRDFDNYLRSPYHNRRSDVVLLFEFLCADRSFDKALAFQAISPGQPYDDKQLRYTTSFLYGLMKDWLALQAFYEDRNYQKVLLVGSLRRKGLKKVFEKEHKIALSELDHQATQVSNFHLHRSQLYYEEYNHVSASSRSEMTGFKEWLEEWTLNFVEGRLKQALVAQSYQVMTGSDIQLEFLPEILKKIETYNGPLPPNIATYYCCYKALTADDSLTYFEELHKMLIEHGSRLPREELLLVYRAAINYCIRRLNNGEEPFKYQVFMLYKEGLNQAIFVENGYLSRFSYKNIVASALGLKEFDWVAHFIEQYRDEVEPKFRHSAYHFNLALLHFVKNESDHAMQHLLEVGTDDVPNNLNARRMLLRIYYDKRELQALESHLDSFRTYIYRRRDLGYLKDLYLNLIKFTRRLLNLDFRNPEQVARLREDISSTKLVAEKEWLLAIV